MIKLVVRCVVSEQEIPDNYVGKSYRDFYFYKCTTYNLWPVCFNCAIDGDICKHCAMPRTFDDKQFLIKYCGYTNYECCSSVVE